jgi:branched-subunit amino acid transport protein
MSEAMQAVNETDGWTLLAILGLTGITVLTRSFFMWSQEKMAIPEWFQRGLHYAPVAAMAAVIVPEIVMKNGALIDSFSDARIYGAAVGLIWYFTRGGVFGTILSGMAVYLPLHLLAGWEIANHSPLTVKHSQAVHKVWLG